MFGCLDFLLPNETPILIFSGIWRAGCIHQCQLIQRIAEANDGKIDLRLWHYCGHMAAGSRLIMGCAPDTGTIGRRYGRAAALWHE